jgi:hypothetical protein
MPLPPPTLADAFAVLHRAVQDDAASARARRDAVQAAFLAFLAALLRQLEGLARAHARQALPPSVPGATAQPLPHSPYAVPYGTPGPRTARHRGPVPARRHRRGRLPLWWDRNRGARAIPRQAPTPHPAQPARAPPHAYPPPSVTKQRPNRGAYTHVR